MKFELGKRARDKITGFEGTLTVYLQYLGQTDSYGIAGKAIDNKFPETVYLDISRIELIDKQS